jgi:hypothetical protein
MKKQQEKPLQKEKNAESRHTTKQNLKFLNEPFGLLRGPKIFYGIWCNLRRGVMGWGSFSGLDILQGFLRIFEKI